VRDLEFGIWDLGFGIWWRIRLRPHRIMPVAGWEMQEIFIESWAPLSNPKFQIPNPEFFRGCFPGGQFGMMFAGYRVTLGNDPPVREPEEGLLRRMTPC